MLDSIDHRHSWSLGYFKRSDIPTHFDVAEGWTVADMYQEGMLAATDPNRIMWMSGTVNNPGTPSNPNGTEGMMLDNAFSPGCQNYKLHLNCFPLKWYVFEGAYQGLDADLGFQENSPRVLARGRCLVAAIPRQEQL